MLLHYKDIKNKIVALMAYKNDQLGFQKQIVNSLCKYEERNFAYISERPEMTVKALNRMILGGQQNNNELGGHGGVDELPHQSHAPRHPS